MIQFIAPGALYGLIFLAVPVIIHLFNFRRFKKVLFTNVRFLKELQEETTRTSRLKHLLILLSRLLAVLFLVLAFAQPIINRSEKQVTSSSALVSIFVDNSFSMNAVGPQGTLLEVAKSKAGEIARSFPQSTRFQLLSSDFSAVQQRTIDRDEFLEETAKLSLSPFSRTINEVVLRQKDAMSQAGLTEMNSFIISDFQESAMQEPLQADSSLVISLVALPMQETPNVFIDSCWLASPLVQLNEPVEVEVKVVNAGSTDIENVPLRLSINGRQKAVSGVTLSAGESMVVPFSMTIQEAGWQAAQVQINDHPVTFDDSYYFSFEVKEKVNVLVVHESSPLPYPEAVFRDPARFNLQRSDVRRVDFSLLKDQHLIVLEDISSLPSGFSDELRKTIEGGGTVCLFPDSAGIGGQLTSFLSGIGADAISGVREGEDRVADVEWNHPLFADVFDRSKMGDNNLALPGFRKLFDWQGGAGGSGEVLMKTRGGQPFLSVFSKGKGQLFVFSVPMRPGFSELARHSVFAPLLYRMALLGARQMDAAYTIGTFKPVMLYIPAPTGDETMKLTLRGKDEELIPRVRVLSSALALETGDQLRDAGHYDLSSGNQIVAVPAFNYDRKESVMRFLNEEKLDDWLSASNGFRATILGDEIPNLTRMLTVMNQGTPLWKWAVVLCLLFLILEICLIRFWKTA